MTEYLDQRGYEETKTKLANLERRQATILARADLSPSHREQVLCLPRNDPAVPTGDQDLRGDATANDTTCLTPLPIHDFSQT